ncbi:MAG TPA: VOC family protein [Candidatus Stackebrandtia excrementipullorum]|nr:VOC family protein [Candidatus Stackebrandtia excrementipullorum]
MSQMFVNLPVTDLNRSKAFFERLGFSFNPDFTSENGTCMIVGDDAFVMLLTEEFFKTFTDRPVAEASEGTEAIVAISADTRDDVDRIVDTAMESGGAASKPPMSADGMYSRSFADPDGHLWEVVYMDMSAMATA